MALADTKPTAAELKSLHKLIKKVTWDIEHFSYNTSVAAFMICLNELVQQKSQCKEIYEQMLILLSPFTPHISEELWHVLGHDTSICDAQWPVCNEEYLVEQSVKYTVLFNGKPRFNIEVPAGTDSAEVQNVALNHEQAAKWLTPGAKPKKVIVVPGKIVNVVV